MVIRNIYLSFLSPRSTATALTLALFGAAVYYLIQQFELHEALRPHNLANPDHPSIAFLGDSHTEVPNWDTLLNCHGTANYGTGGDTSAQILKRLDNVIAARPRLVIVMAGTNDALQEISPEVTVLNIESIKRKLRAERIPHVVLAPPPLPAKADAIEVISDAATLKIPFAATDLLDDGVHLRRSGYAKWRDALEPFSKTLCK
jgi:lysophospholipase L1-like esterase